MVLIRVFCSLLGRLSHGVCLLGHGSGPHWIQLALRLDRRSQGSTVWENSEEKGEEEVWPELSHSLTNKTGVQTTDIHQECLLPA